MLRLCSGRQLSEPLSLFVQRYRVAEEAAFYKGLWMFPEEITSYYSSMGIISVWT